MTDASGSKTHREVLVNHLFFIHPLEIESSGSSQGAVKRRKTGYKRNDTSETLNTDDLGEISLNGGHSPIFDASLGDDLNLDEVEL